ncbi:hypothetical protein F2P79_024968 [Pimephales promelas]|nr:hypothetical protein F2P79_024968 [Pimephales promelas]
MEPVGVSRASSVMFEYECVVLKRSLVCVFQVLPHAEAFQKILREEEKRRRKEEKRKEIRKGPRISRSRSEL